MNFLSHFYFDRNTSDPNQVIGAALPDLIKNANKSWILHPEKITDKFITDPNLSGLYKGWTRHIAVDLFFHSSDFFLSRTHELRLLIYPLIAHSPVKPFFLAHIALELMLDGLLLTEDVVNADHFYQKISQANRTGLEQFLKLNNVPDSTIFFTFLDQFISSAYLHTYREAHNIMYALNRICLRIWAQPLTETQKLELTALFTEYQQNLKLDFLSIFDEIHHKLGD